MALIKCPECNKKISETANNCPKCGYQFLGVEIDAIIENEKKSKRRRRLFWFFLIFLLLALPNIIKFCNSSKNKNSNNSPPVTVPHKDSFHSTPVLPRYNNYSFDIINSTRYEGIKSSIDIRLQERVSKNELKKIAMDLRNDEPETPFFITYYLPGMEPGSGAWATSHFTPDLEIIIYGIPLDEQKELASDSTNGTTGSIIGEWLLEIIGAKYTFLKKDGKIIMVRQFLDGSGSETEMIQKKQDGKTRFEEKKGNSFGEYYIVEQNGDLATYDKSGFIRTMPLLK